MEAFPSRLAAYSLSDADGLFSFIISKSLPSEDSETCCNRVLRDYFLIPSLFRQLLMQQDDICVGIFETLRVFLPSNPTSNSVQTDTFHRLIGTATEERDNKESNRRK